MLRRFQASFVLLVCLVSLPAAAAEAPTDDSPNERKPAEPPTMAPPAPATMQPPSATPTEAKPVAEPASVAEQPGPWQVEVNGYFRAPLAMGLSSRPGPDNQMGPASTQVSYAPNRVVDSSYYSFAYTRLQELDWAEVFIHAKKKHVDAAVGWMGYWFGAVGFRNPDAAWAPGLAYIALDTDFMEGARLKPNIALTAGAWWPSFGYFEKYDTYTLGRFRQIGEQLKLTVPLSSDLAMAFVEGFGAGRDGHWSPGTSPLYSTTTALDLVTWANVELTYKKYLDVGLHYNTEWTADPNLAQGTVPGDKSYAAYKAAHLTVAGAEVNVRAPYVGRLWLSPSYINVRNGWALANGGTEVMHSLGGAGIATNYMGFNNSPGDSTGSGSMLNLGLLYENTLSGVQGEEPGRVHEVTLSIFGLLAKSSLDLPPLPAGTAATSTRPQSSITQFKYGADVTLQYLTWLAFMLRYDAVNDNLSQPGFVFSSITPRAIISSHFLSRERIYIQYSRYIYGDKMVLAGTWPWGTPIVAGTDILQGGPYSGKKPDENVVKIQADVAF
jgi:hypothetical protein